MIPILDLTQQYKQLKPKIDEAVLNVLSSGSYISWRKCSLFRA